MEREDIENSLKVLSHIVDDDFIITVDEARKIIRIDGETIQVLQAEVQKLKRVNLEIFEDLPKLGEWIEVDGLYKCSVCGELECCRGKYCPDCGARMEAQERDDE